LSENAPLFKEGYVLRKNIMDGPHKKGNVGGCCRESTWYDVCVLSVTRGKRQWKPYYAYLKGFLLYLERVSTQ
jgi:hypothetical protein